MVYSLTKLNNLQPKTEKEFNKTLADLASQGQLEGVTFITKKKISKLQLKVRVF